MDRTWTDGRCPGGRHAATAERHRAGVGRTEQRRDLVGGWVAARHASGRAHEQTDRCAEMAQLLQEQQQPSITAYRLQVLLMGDDHTERAAARRLPVGHGDLASTPEEDEHSAKEQEQEQEQEVAAAAEWCWLHTYDICRAARQDGGKLREKRQRVRVSRNP